MRGGEGRRLWLLEGRSKDFSHSLPGRPAVGQ